MKIDKNAIMNFSIIKDYISEFGITSMTSKQKELLKQFIETQNEFELLHNECELIINELNKNIGFKFNFSQSGGQNESDNQGWYMMYNLYFDSDFC